MSMLNQRNQKRELYDFIFINSSKQKKEICGLVSNKPWWQWLPLQKNRSRRAGEEVWRRLLGGGHVSFLTGGGDNVGGWCSLVIIHWDTHLQFVHFSVCVLYFNKKFKIETTTLRCHFPPLSARIKTSDNTWLAGELPAAGHSVYKVFLQDQALYSSPTYRDV